MNQEIKHHFIQACAAFGSLRTYEAIEMLKPICRKYSLDTPDKSLLRELITTANLDLNQYDHNIAFLKYPITRDEFIVFSTVSSKGVTLINHLSEQDQSYFRLLLMTIAISESYGIPEIQAINLTTQMIEKPLAKSRAEILLQSWKQIGYFVESDDVLFFGPRLIVEFETYLLNSFPDEVKECTLCKKIVLWDPSCNECKTRFHSECIRKYLIKSSNCPACQKLWTTPATAIRYST